MNRHERRALEAMYRKKHGPAELNKLKLEYKNLEKEINASQAEAKKTN